MDLKDRTSWAINFVAQKENLTIGKIARMVRSKPDTVRKCLEKVSAPRINFISRFCHTFGFDFQWFTHGEGEPFLGAAELFEDLGFSSTTDTGEIDADNPLHVLPGNSCTKGPVLEKDVRARGSEGKPGPMDMDAEMSLQKLSLLAGIKINSNWVFDLAQMIGVAAWKISMSVYNGIIDPDLIKCIENCGYGRHEWAVLRKSNGCGSAEVYGIFNKMKLLQFADEILQSGTVHASSLALSIISMKMAIKENKPMPIQGSKAIKME